MDGAAMKPTLFALGALAALACGREPASREPPPPAAPSAPPAPRQSQERPPPTPTPAQLRAQTVDALARAVAARDAGAYAARFSDDAVSGGPAAKDEGKGRGAIRLRMERLLAPMSHPTLAVARTLSVGERLVVEWVLSGAHDRDGLGVPAAGARLSMRGASVLTFDDAGVVREERVYYDEGTFAAQAGATDGRPPPAETRPRSDAGSPARVDVIDAAVDGDPQRRHVDVVRSLFAAFDARDDAAYGALLHDDVTWHDASHALPSRGAAEARRFARALSKALPDARATLTWAAGVGDRWVVTEVVVAGTHKATLRGEKPTRRAVLMRSLDVLELDAGRVARVWTYGDGADVRAQMGER
ncbi:MAG: ester cyclase [Myxococcales bacterium]|nr:ester cyclase [Myxococcales bacterium]